MCIISQIKDIKWIRVVKLIAFSPPSLLNRRASLRMSAARDDHSLPQDSSHNSENHRLYRDWYVRERNLIIGLIPPVTI